MATDVRLDEGDGTFVVVAGRVLKVAGSDLVLDAADRRRDQTPSRRALVHDPSDGLTINFGGDYPGGVTVQGDATITGRLRLAGDDVESTLESLRLRLGFVESMTTGRLDLLETTVASLVELMGAVVVPPWRTKLQVDQGDDESATGGGAAIPSATALGLTVDLQSDRQVPGFEHEDVISIEPVAGTAVRRGSTVTVTVNLEG
jgi:hypothetical protein